MPASKSTRRRKPPTPRLARTDAAIARMPFDNIMLGPRGAYGILVTPTSVHLDKTVKGESLGKVEMPRWIFEAFADWYNYGTIPPGEKRKSE
jgi:hypothetical protein